MPRSSNQKQKLLLLADIFRTETNEDHPITLARLIEILSNNGIEAERKSLYDDIEVLCQYGMDIEKVGASRNTAYYYAGGTFGQIYYTIDALQQAIREKKKIRFLYFDYDCRKTKRYHNGGAYSEVSPYALCWREENYYLVGYYGKYDGVTNFRADKIEKVEILDEKRIEPPKDFNLNEYTKKRFGMFSGSDLRVTLRVHNSLSGVIFDRFGKSITVYNDDTDENYFVINQPVTASPVFYGWICQFGEKMEILAPDNIRKDFKDYIKKIYNIYK